MTSYPRKSKLFKKWAEAMVAGATVDKPSYPGTKKTSKSRRKKPRRRKRNRKKRNAKKNT